MTVICWDGKTLAADKQSSDNGLRRTVTKIRRGRGGVLIGSSGDHATAKALFYWWDTGANAADFPDKEHKADLLVVHGDGTLSVYEGTAAACSFEDKFFAMGHGRDFATAAMALGRDAKDAVELTCKFDVYCGMGIDTLTLDETRL